MVGTGSRVTTHRIETPIRPYRATTPYLVIALTLTAACGPPQQANGRPATPKVRNGQRSGNDAPAVPGERAIAQARELVRAGKLQDAFTLLSKTHAASRGDAVALELARVSLRLGDRAGAARLVDETPNAVTPDLAVLKALTLRELGDARSARAVVAQALTVDPTGADGEKADRRLSVLAADLAVDAGDPDRAHAIVEALLLHDAKDPAAWAALARVLLSEGKAGAARYVAERALNDGLEAAELHAARGAIALAEDDPTGAAKHLARALELDPTDGAAAVRLGLLRLDHGDAAGALAPLARAVELWPADIDARVALAAARRLSSDAAGAVAELERALALAPDDARALYAAAKLYDEDLEKPDRALELYRRFVKVKGVALPDGHPARGALKALESKQGGSK